MVFVTDTLIKDRRKLRGRLGQVGYLNSAGLEFRPIGARLRLYERMARQDTTLKTALNNLVNIIVGTVGEVVHPDEEVKNFLNYNLAALEDEHGRSWRDCMTELQWTLLWSGYTIGEPLFDLDEGTLRLMDMPTYHPLSIILRPDLQGRLSEGKDTRTEKKSGIYQLPFNVPGKQEILLPQWKTIYMGNDNEYGNWYGHSILSPAYKWYRFKEAITDMFAIALSKLGRRLVWVRSPSYATDQMRVDPSTGIEHAITTLDLIKEQIEADEDFGDVLLMPQQQPEIKPEVGSVPLADQFGEAYLQAIRFADQMAVREIIPYFLLADSTEELFDQAIERRMETFYYALEVRRARLLRPIARKALMPLVHWNYARESAKVAPEFTKVFSDRPEDRVATMQMVKGLTELGYLNPTNTVDWGVVRQMVRVAEREMDEKDKKFIKEILIDPHKKKDSQGAKRGTQGAGREGRPMGDSTPQDEARPRGRGSQES